MNPQALLEQRHRDYAKAQNRHVRASERRQAAEEHVKEEAELVSFLVDGQAGAVRMAPRLRVSASGVEGLSSEVMVDDVLSALREELSVLELDALLCART